MASTLNPNCEQKVKPQFSPEMKSRVDEVLVNIYPRLNDQLCAGIPALIKTMASFDGSHHIGKNVAPGVETLTPEMMLDPASYGLNEETIENACIQFLKYKNSKALKVKDLLTDDLNYSARGVEAETGDYDDYDGDDKSSLDLLSAEVYDRLCGQIDTDMAFSRIQVIAENEPSFYIKILKIYMCTLSRKECENIREPADLAHKYEHDYEHDYVLEGLKDLRQYEEGHLSHDLWRDARSAASHYLADLAKKNEVLELLKTPGVLTKTIRLAYEKYADEILERSRAKEAKRQADFEAWMQVKRAEAEECQRRKQAEEEERKRTAILKEQHVREGRREYYEANCKRLLELDKEHPDLNFITPKLWCYAVAHADLDLQEKIKLKCPDTHRLEALEELFIKFIETGEFRESFLLNG